MTTGRRRSPRDEQGAGDDTLRFEAQILRSVGQAVIATTPTGQITYWNRGAEMLYGWSAGEVLGLDIVEVTPSQVSQEQAREVMKRLGAGESWSGEFQVRRKDGSSFLALVTDTPILDDAGNLVGIVGVSSDVSEWRRAEEALRQSEERYRVLVETSPDAIVVADLTARLMFANHRAAELHGYEDPSEMVGLDGFELVAPVDRELAAQNMAKAIAAGHGAGVIHRVLRRDGTEFPVEVTGAVIKDGAGDPTGIVTIARDITQQVANEEQLRRLALYDPLTGLPNRTLFGDRVQRLLTAARRRGDSLAVLLLDLNQLQEVNDTLGHDVGDRLLQRAAELISDAMRESDSVGRLGGDEFVALLSATDDARAILAAQRLQENVRQPVRIEGHEIYLNLSIGIALFPQHGSDVATLLRRADIAMRNAKRSPSGWALYQEAEDRHIAERLALVSDLRRTIENEELVLWYQPKVDLHTGIVRGVEAMVRWNHPQRGTLAACDFVPLAERSGLIKPLTAWALRSAVAQIRAWEDAGRRVAVSVNLSVWDLQEPELLEDIRQLLQASQIDARLLGLEITESALMTDPPEALRTLQQLHDMGLTISIDDFGTGYSSLSYLHRLPIDEVKIDRSFVLGMQQDQRKAEAIVRTVTDLGHNLGLRVVAEGVETERIAARLTAAGCDAAQGYLYARPMPAAEIVRWLDERMQSASARQLQSAAERAHATLREQILRQVYEPGSRLPSRVELAARLNVGVKTVAEVCKALEDEGLVHTEWGRGTFVSR